MKHVQAYCFLKQITKDEEILKFAKIVIDPTINISWKYNFFLDKLFNALKQDTRNKRWQHTSKFISNFRKLFYDAEINKYLKLFGPNQFAHKGKFSGPSTILSLNHFSINLS